MHERYRDRFLAGGGEMGSCIRSHDWGSTSLGEPSSWPHGLKISVRLLLSTGHPMFIWWGPDLLQFYNDAYCRSIGPERHPSALGQQGRDCWAEIWDIIGPQIEQVMSGDGHTWHENQLVPITRHGEREEVYWTYSYSPIDEPAAPNGIGGVLVVCTETTEQVLAEKRLRAAEARWRSLFAQAPGFMAILRGPEHVFEFANPQYYKLVSGRDIIGKPVREALPEVEEQGFVALLDDVYRSGNAHSGRATPVLLAGGAAGKGRRYLDFVYQPIKDSSGEVAGILVDGYDVTERVWASEALREQDRRKNEFLAILGHELRNPLAPLSSGLQILQQGTQTPEAAKKLHVMMRRQLRHLVRLVDDLVDVSRISSGKLELQQGLLDLNEVAKAAVDFVAPLAEDRSHTLTVADAGEPLVVYGDFERLTQVIANLLTNAVKYTRRGGAISLRTESDGGTAWVRVVDNGLGIPPDRLDSLFELFWQLPEHRDDFSGAGLGVGLSLARQIVDLHGGAIEAHSEGLGQGSEFAVRLPLAHKGTGEAPPASATTFTDSKRRRVLVVDDNADAADSLCMLLALLGHDARAAHDGPTALELVQSFSPEAVLLDIGLPGMNGYEVAHRIRALLKGESIFLIALTGWGQNEDKQRSIEAGFDEHLTKPVERALLSELLSCRFAGHEHS